MSETSKDFLFSLIKSLTRSEKRQFKVYVNRLGINADAKFLLLFDALDKMKEYKDQKIFDQKITSRQQLSNLKAHLYGQILISLRTNPSNQNVRIQLREQLDFATILYNKGLYKQSLKILDKAKQTAKDLEEKNIAYEIVEFEKVIESQYITRSINTRADDLIQDAKYLSQLNALNSKLSNLSLKLYGMMLSNGYANNVEDRNYIEEYFYENLPKKDLEMMGFREQLWFYKAQVWKNLLLQNFQEAYHNASQWVSLFYEHPEMIITHPVWFVKGNSYQLNSLFILRDAHKFTAALEKFENFIHSYHFPKNENTEAVTFTVLYNAKVNAVFLHGQYDETDVLIKEIFTHKEFHDDRIDDHHILILYYKIASLYYGRGSYTKAIKEFKKIIYHKASAVREDLHFHSRLLILMSMVDSGFDEELDDFYDETLRYYRRMKQPNAFCKLSLDLIKEYGDAFPDEKLSIANRYLANFRKLDEIPFNRRNFVYVDMISWLESHINRLPLADIIKNKSKVR